MKNFGKFTAKTERLGVPGLPIGVDENGVIIPGETQYFNVLIFRDEDGEDLIEVARANEHPFYIAVTDSGAIISMTDDIEQSQISDHDIIGIDSDYGFTFGPGGSVYGMVWDGSKITIPVEPPPNEISRRQFFQQLAVMEIITKPDALAAMQGGVIPAPLQAIIDQLPTEDDQFNAQMLVIGADTFNRTHPLAETVRLALNWTEEQKDDFWRDAYKI